MASITKRSFLSVLAGLIFASIASAEARGLPTEAPGAKAGAWSVAQGRQSSIINHQSAIPLQVPFIRNQGQIADSQVLFYARTFGGTVYVTAEGELVYALPKAEEVRSQRSEVSRTAANAECRMQNAECSESEGLKQTVDRGPWTVDESEQTTEMESEPTAHSPQSTVVPRLAIIRETLVDADLIAAPSGAERSGTIINSFIGNDPRRWQANIPSFTGVQFGDVYEGISLEVRATGDNVEKIFTVAPGADPARIALCLAGAEGVSITPSGELEARTALGPVRFTAPVAYQRSAAGERQSVSVAYALESDQVGFCVGAFDAARPLVIDPLLASTFIGGTSNNVISAMALDSKTNVLVAGYTASMDFPATNGYATNYNGGNYDGFIAKFGPQLTNLLAATYIGGAGEDAIMAMTINANDGVVYVAGYTASTNFPITNAVYDNYSGTDYKGGDYDAFVSVLDSNLVSLTKSTYIGGTNVDKAYAVALNLQGNVYVAGYTASTNFPTNNWHGATFQNTLNGSNDAFVTKLIDAGPGFIASTFVGGSSNDQAFGMAFDTNNYLYLTGVTSSTNFPVTNGYQMTRSGAGDAFVTKLHEELTSVVASTYLGGTSNEVAYGIAVAPFTNTVCVVGYTTSTNYHRSPTNTIAPGYNNQLSGGKDAFLTRLDPLLTNLQASTYLGGTGDDEATAVLVSATTNTPLRIYVAGHTTSANFPVTSNAYDTVANGGRDAFVSYFSASNTLQASTYLGGSTNDSAYAMALQADRFSLFVAGATASTNFPATLHAYDPDRAGQTNDYGFVTKLGAGLAYGSLKWKVTMSDPASDGYDRFLSPSLGWDGTIYVGGGSNLYAYDANGNELWRFRANGRLNDYGGTYDGLGSTPAIARDGTIYFGTQNGYLHAVSKYGVGIWTNLFSGQQIYSSPAIGNDGVIYCGSAAAFALYAVSSNGAVKWTNTVASSIIGSPAIDTNGRIYVANSSPSPKLYMIDTNNVTLTNWSMPDASVSSSPLIGSNGWVYIGCGSRLYGFDPNSTASQTWTTAGTIYSSPAMDSNGVIYVGGGNNLYAFNTNGNTNHTWNTGGAVKSSPAIAEDGTIYVGSADNHLYAFSPDGSTNWVSDEADSYVTFQSPLIIRDKTVYFTDFLNLYAFFGKSQIAQSSWPTYKHDALRTGNAGFDAAEILKPTGLTASQGAYSNYVDVRWNGDANADYYELFRGTNDLATASLYQTRLTTNYTDTNIASGMIYSYWVRVATPVVMSDFSAGANGGVPPLPPTNVVASKGNPTNAIVITWDVSANATRYYIWHSRTNDTNNAVQVGMTTNPVATFTDTTITRGLTNYYWVKAGNGLVGISGFSDGDYGGTPPLPPNNIWAGQGVASQAVDITWSAATGATMYAVYRNESTNVPADFMAVTNSLAFADTNATQFRHYYYWVRATNEFGLGEFSAWTNGWRCLEPPLAVYATKGVFTNQIRVSWQIESTAPTSYRVYRNMTNNPAAAVFQAEIAFTDSTATNYDDSNITRGAGYYYWVKSKNAYGTSEFSVGDSVANLGGTVPFPPIYVSASDGTDATRVLVTWTGDAFATAYEVYRQNTYDLPSPLTPPLKTVYGTDYYSDTNAGSGYIYYYWVKATNQFGRSELSWFNTGWRTLSPPSGVEASDGVSTGYVQVKWSGADNSPAATYELWRSASSDFGDALMLYNAVPTTNYYDTDATPGVRFYYWARAKTSQFISEFSAYDSGWRALGEVDLGVADLVFLPTRMAVGGAPAAVSFCITNCGAQNMDAPNTWITCNLYISSNSVYGADATLMGGATVSVPLTAHNSAVVVLPKAVRDSITAPAVPPGSYNIFVKIEHASMWLDPNLGNNTTNRNGGSIQVGTNQPAGLLLVNDYNGDGYTDLAMYQEATGAWQIWLIGPEGVTDEIAMSNRGGPDFQPVPADYDGDGRTDPAVYQEATGTWKIWFSASDYALACSRGWGGSGFEPVPGDFDGDGHADPAVYQEATGTWRVWRSASGYSMVSGRGWGGASFQPVQGDYDGDERADTAVYQEASGAWRVWMSGAGYALAGSQGMGGSGYCPVVADYDGDGIMDLAVFRASTGTWLIWLSSRGYAEIGAQGWGNTGTVAVPGDFDGDGITDPAVYWDSFNMWRLWRSSQGYQEMRILACPPGDGFRPVWQ